MNSGGSVPNSQGLYNNPDHEPNQCSFSSLLLLLLLLLSLLLLLLGMLFISRSKDSWKIICISSLCSIDKLLLPSFTIFSFLLQLPISSSVSEIIKELSSFSYSFQVRHLSFNNIMKKVISSQNKTDPINFSTQDIIQKCPLLFYTFKNLLISYFL